MHMKAHQCKIKIANWVIVYCIIARLLIELKAVEASYEETGSLSDRREWEIRDAEISELEFELSRLGQWVGHYGE